MNVLRSFVRFRGDVTIAVGKVRGMSDRISDTTRRMTTDSGSLTSNTAGRTTIMRRLATAIRKISRRIRRGSGDTGRVDKEISRLKNTV